MEEENIEKNFKISGDSTRKVVKFGKSRPSQVFEDKPKAESVNNNEDYKKPVIRTRERGVAAATKTVNDNFAKYSQREPLAPGEYPRELKKQFSLNTELEEAFGKLDQGQRDGYLFYFSVPKLTGAITNRIVKKIDRIIAGHGLNDCTCRKSKNFPNCDGSHKTA